MSRRLGSSGRNHGTFRSRSRSPRGEWRSERDDTEQTQRQTVRRSVSQPKEEFTPPEFTVKEFLVDQNDVDIFFGANNGNIKHLQQRCQPARISLKNSQKYSRDLKIYGTPETLNQATTELEEFSNT